jgi:hypothetical protein
MRWLWVSQPIRSMVGAFPVTAPIRYGLGAFHHESAAGASVAPVIAGLSSGPGTQPEVAFPARRATPHRSEPATGRAEGSHATRGTRNPGIAEAPVGTCRCFHGFYLLLVGSVERRVLRHIRHERARGLGDKI